MIRWGIVATIKAPARDILNFAAYHSDLGAHRIYLYLDAPDDVDAIELIAPLKAHPKVRIVSCDATYWHRRGITRPQRHQVRQSVNATHAYAREPEVDWLAHIDGDEFLWPDARVDSVLDALPAHVFCARMRPMESLAGDGGFFKAFIPAGMDRAAMVARLYPEFGPHLRGGFLSHVAGKLFVRTGAPDLNWRIHKVFRDGETNPGQRELEHIALCHLHVRTWKEWRASLPFRLERGAYRAELSGKGDMPPLHALLNGLSVAEGETGLRRFFDEVCAENSAVMARLQSAGLLRRCDLDLDRKRRAHFPTTPDANP